MNMNKALKRNTAASGVALIVSLASCTKQADQVTILTGSPTPTSSDIDNNTQLTKVVKKQQAKEQVDSLALDSAANSAIDCYRWDGEIQASSQVLNEADNTVYDLNILITLYNVMGTHYEGGMVLYVNEDDFVEAVVRGESEGNHITLFYVEDEANTTGDIFKDGDKLVMYELQNGEYSASWYKAMHRFVNETTVISMK